ncbi:J domain-containing protein [Gloeocapsopsis crepidinum LEGE 06123]|uniref:J domain-containing protein n=2 Tax=Gloeocapsopsis crepidinum TaxID=693223 RepID=A0ABR9UW90_9CHRO|nr:DnaJ domain-containing protein [Gloeocapsopsis crepidinum]MBE9192570.1 J domain-containing protein [Gloeocapsopsis crepidinum LEGE 06123]
MIAYYQVLGLTAEATLEEIKAAYRKLVQQYHPDINPGDHHAREKFIAITEAYRKLLDSVQSTQAPQQDKTEPSVKKSPATKVTRKNTSPYIPPLSAFEFQVKWNSYRELQKLWKHKRFTQAIALAETLFQKLPQDPEVKSWLASSYQRWGRQLIGDRQLETARIYLKKALKTDPHNRSLWSEVERDFRRMERIFR